MLPNLKLDSKLSNLAGIGPTYQQKLTNLGLVTIQDLIYYFPFRYEDLTRNEKISQLSAGQVVTITASIWQITKIRTKTGKSLIKAVIADSTGRLEAVWFNQDFLLTVLKPNMVFSFSGKVGFFGNKLSLVNAKFEKLEAGKDLVHTGRLVPIYSETAGLTSRWIRNKIHQLLTDFEPELTEILPKLQVQYNSLVPRLQALREIHFPSSLEQLTKARDRLAFEELFYFHLRNLDQKKQLVKTKNKNWVTDSSALQEFKQLLTFSLTNSQESAIDQIRKDLQGENAMRRLLQGEVGSGKTVVSAYALFVAVQNGYQGAFLAPTEILAQQHFQTLKAIFKDNLKLELSTGSIKPKADDFNIIVGTHAILQDKVIFSNLGLIVIDEQQRFGVLQRQILMEKAKQAHLLTMTATPIPRTLALTLYGQLDISTLTEIPTGPKKVKTYLVPEEKRDKAYNFLGNQIHTGGQLLIICPLINQSESLESVKSASVEFTRLKEEVFPDFKVGLLHGRLKSKDKSAVLDSFRSGKLDILVATPVVEVGIDIPTVNLILIEAADRFGLSSLHQLRGRVGRAGQESYCLLFTESISERTQERLKLLEKYNDGLKLAELDLKLRGSGDLYGTLQHGSFELKTADFINLELIEKTQKAAVSEFEKGLDPKTESTLAAFFPKQQSFIAD